MLTKIQNKKPIEYKSKSAKAIKLLSFATQKLIFTVIKCINISTVFLAMQYLITKEHLSKDNIHNSIQVLYALLGFNIVCHLINACIDKSVVFTFRGVKDYYHDFFYDFLTIKYILFCIYMFLLRQQKELVLKDFRPRAFNYSSTAESIVKGSIEEQLNPVNAVLDRVTLQPFYALCFLSIYNSFIFYMHVFMYSLLFSIVGYIILSILSYFGKIFTYIQVIISIVPISLFIAGVFASDIGTLRTDDKFYIKFGSLVALTTLPIFCKKLNELKNSEFLAQSKRIKISKLVILFRDSLHILFDIFMHTILMHYVCTVSYLFFITNPDINATNFVIFKERLFEAQISTILKRQEMREKIVTLLLCFCNIFIVYSLTRTKYSKLIAKYDFGKSEKN